MIEQTSIPFGRESLTVKPSTATSGIRRTIALREGLALNINDVTHLEDAEYTHVGGEYLKVHYKLTGKHEIRGESGEYIPVEAGNISFFVQPSASLKRERIRLNTRERSITLICTRDFASSILPGSGDDLPDQIAEYLRNRTSTLSLASRPLLPPVRAIVEDILNPCVTGRLRDLLIEAKVLELICATIQQIRGNDIIRAKDRAKVRELCALLEENPGANYSIHELCRMLAWNENQMMDCFKRVTGTTIWNYRQHVRMDRAKRQLRDTDASITDIAFDAGYEHPANFATAFRRAYGYSPRMARSRYV